MTTELQVVVVGPAESGPGEFEALRQRVRQLLGGAAAAPPLARIAVRLRGRTVIVPAEQIDWLEARDNYVRLHVGAEHYLVRGRISWFEARLDPRRFVRVHRGALVNLERVAEVRPRRRGEAVVLRSGMAVPVGATRRRDVLRRLGDAPPR